MGVAVSVERRILVGMGTVGVAVDAAAKAPGRRMMKRVLQSPSNNNRLRQPMTAVPARLEFKILLMAFIPWFLCGMDRVLCASRIIRRTTQLRTITRQSQPSKDTDIAHVVQVMSVTQPKLLTGIKRPAAGSGTVA